MADVKRVRQMPDAHLLPDWLTEDVVSTLIGAGLVPHHNNNGAVIDVKDATDLDSSKALAKAIADTLVDHGADVGLHSAADETIEFDTEYTSAPDLPADLTEVQNILNEAKSLFNAHLANATVHRSVGGAGGVAIGTITTANANSQATANALANAIKAAYNRHAKMGISAFVVD